MISIISSHRRQKEFDVWGLSGIQSRISAHLEETWVPGARLLALFVFTMELGKIYHFSDFFFLYMVSFFFCDTEVGKASDAFY